MFIHGRLSNMPTFALPTKIHKILWIPHFVRQSDDVCDSTRWQDDLTFGESTIRQAGISASRPATLKTAKSNVTSANVLLFKSHLVTSYCMHTHTHTQPFYGPLGFVWELPGWAGTRKVKPIWIYWSKRQWVAVIAHNKLKNQSSPFIEHWGLRCITSI